MGYGLSLVCFFVLNRSRRARLPGYFRQLSIRIIGAIDARKRVFTGAIVIVEGLKVDLVLAQEFFIFADTIQQLSLRESALPRTWGEVWHAGRPGFRAIGTGELAVTFDLAVLTEDASEDPMWLRRSRRLRRASWGAGLERRHGR